MTEILTATEFSSWYDENFDGMETYRKCIIPILSGLIAKDKFPVLNRLIPNLSKQQYRGQRLIDKESIVGDEFRDSETYRLRYNEYIREIIDFLTDFYTLVPENIIVSDNELTVWDLAIEGPFQQGKVYLEIGEAARPTHYIGGAPSESQIELLFITDAHYDDQYGPQVSFFGASFNPNKYLTKDGLGNMITAYERSAFDIYIGDNEEENTHVLNHVFELTYDGYVALVKHLNKPSRISLNYPGGIR
jgi:hypothetical protein